MRADIHAATVNRLLEPCTVAAGGALAETCERVDVSLGEVLCEADAPIRHVIFPIDCVICLFATVDDDASIDVGLIGSEGMFGVPLALGVGVSSLRAVVQVAGGAWRMPADTFRRLLARSPAMRTEMHRYAHVLMAQFGQTVACTCFHVLEARLARWLLMTLDRVQGDRLYLTQDLLSRMLGVRRSSVTHAAGALQRQGLIRYSRGSITVLDRVGLERAACSCYERTAAVSGQAAPGVLPWSG